MHQHRISKLLFLTVCSLMVASDCSPVAAQSAESALPFVGTDSVTILKPGGGSETLPGLIDNIAGETLTFRRSGEGNLQFIRVDDVLELQFRRSEAWEQSLQLRVDGKTPQALQLFEKALREEKRTWAWIELQATLVRLFLEMEQRDQAVERIDEILKRDPESRYVVLAPLVWDERLPDSSRIAASENGLRSNQPLHRLIAASVFLHDPEHQEAAKAALQFVRKDPAAGRLRELAEAQLWRLALVDASGKTQFLNVWQDRLRSINSRFRHGPQFVIARCLQKEHRYDDAAVGFLWTALMHPTDPALAAQALSEATVSLHAAGQISEAAGIQKELQQRYPNWHRSVETPTP